MTITLTPEQLIWLEARVETGEFTSVEAAVRDMIDAEILDYKLLESNDMAWAQPLVDEALAEVERGETMSLAEFEARIDARMGALGE